MIYDPMRNALMKFAQDAKKAVERALDGLAESVSVKRPEMKLIDKVRLGLKCCKESMGDENPFEKCKECPYNEISIDVDDCRAVLCADALEFFEPMGTFECFHCGHRSVVWGSDFSFEDYGLDGEGIIHSCTCSNCGAEIEYRVPIE